MYIRRVVWSLVLILGMNILYAGKNKVHISCGEEQANVYVNGGKQATIREGFANIFLEAGAYTIKVVAPVNKQYQKHISKNVRVKENTPMKITLELEKYEPTQKYKKILAVKDKPKLKRWKRSGNVVIDSELGLMWQDDIAVKSVRIKWNDAKKYCQNLSLEGYDDWRLPDYKTLISIVDYDRYQPAIMPSFKNVNILDYYWSENRYIKKKKGAWYVHFYNGRTYYNLKSNENFVRCVRDK